MSIIAAIALKMPLQHYISLTRYQHVGIAIFLFGMGYTMQSIWSWRVYSKWAKMANLATSAFFCSVGLYFYRNTWLEEYATEATPTRYLGRLILMFIYLLLALVVSIFWVKWAHEDNKLKDAAKAKNADVPKTDASKTGAPESNAPREETKKSETEIEIETETKQTGEEAS
jgi:hypothetical protein